MIKSLKIQNYKGINCDIDFTQLSKLCFVAGQNGSGKSNLLAAISEIIYAIEHYLIRGKIKSLIFKFKMVLELKGICYTVTHADYSQVAKLQVSDLPDLYILYNGKYNPHITIEKSSRRLKLNTSQNISKFYLIDFDDYKYILFIFWLFNRQLEYKEILSDIFQIKNLDLKSWKPELEAEITQVINAIKIKQDKDTADEKDVEKQLNNKRLSIGKAQLIPDFTEKELLKILKNKSEVVDFEINIELFNGSTISMSDLSEGQKQYITLLGYTEIFNFSNTIFLLDEPDNAFNPLLQRQFFNNLKYGIHEESQVICCTHSIGSLSTTLDNNTNTLNASNDFNSINGSEFKDFDVVVDDFTQILSSYQDQVQELRKMKLPTVYFEGEIDKKYLERALTFFPEFKQLYENCKISYKDGYGNLDKIWKNKDVISDDITKKVILYYDCDTNKIDEDYESKLFKRIIKPILENPIKNGIENLFPKNTILEFRCSQKRTFTKSIPDADNLEIQEWKIKDSTQKRDLCNWICDKNIADDFKYFKPLLETINEILNKPTNI